MFLAFYIVMIAQLAWAAQTCKLVAASPSAKLRNPPSPASTSRRPSASPRPSTASAGASPSCPTNISPGPIVATAWYAGWHSSNFTLQNVSWSKYTSLIYAFATTTPSSSVIGLTDSDKQIIPQFVQTAHQNRIQAILSVGGWTGSQYFSSAVATDANRTAFAQAVIALVSQYNFDGVEFDWEFPGRQGIGCNVVSSSDSANFLSFLQNLRGQDGAQDFIVSAAVTDTPFLGTNGAAMSDVSGFAQVLDYIEVMNYDIWGSWSSTVGPDAPLDDSCAATQQGSAKSAVKAWTAAGFPASKMILAAPSYGRSFHVSPSNATDASGNIKLYAPFNNTQQPAGDKWDSTASGVDVCGNPNAVGGIFDFWGLINGGFLTTNGTVANGIDYTFDNCSKTPFVYNATSQVMVSYDDARSFVAKGNYINDARLAGFAIWEAGGDSNDTLLDAISLGSGIGC